MTLKELITRNNINARPSKKFVEIKSIAQHVLKWPDCLFGIAPYNERINIANVAFLGPIISFKALSYAMSKTQPWSQSFQQSFVEGIIELERKRG